VRRLGRHGLLYAPVGFGEPDAPSTFHWPTPSDYSQATATAFATMKSAGHVTQSAIGFPVADIAETVLTATASGHQETLIQVLEAATGKGIAALGANIPPGVVNSFFNCLQDALNGNVVGVVVGAAELVANVASALSAIPLIGQMVEAICSVVCGVIDYYEQQAAAPDEAVALCQQGLVQDCKDVFDAAIPLPSGAEGVTPSDMFRGCFYAYQAGNTPPISVASMYVLLCGAETQGFGFSRPAYDALLGAVRGTYPNVGIAPEIQRRMWKLIQGIMWAAEPPGLRVDITPIGDKGRSLFPILQDIVRNEWARYQVTGVGGWNMSLASQMSDFLMGPATERTQIHGGAQASCNCTRPVRRAGLERSLEQSVERWQAVLQENFFKNGKYFFGAEGGITAKSSLVIMKPKAASAITQASVGGAATLIKSKYTAPQKAAMVAGVAGGSYLAWEIVRRLVTGGI